MMNLAVLVAPIFLIILLGNVLRYLLIRDADIWHQINKLSYWVLFPCLVFNKTSVIDFGEIPLFAFSCALLLGFSVAVVFSYVGGKLYGLKAPALSSVIQGGGRHNTFIALAVVSQLYGEQGEIIGAIAIAILVTFSNIMTNIILTIMLRSKDNKKNTILSELRRNPFIVAIMLGLIFNYLGLSNLPILHDFSANVGIAALPVALLCIGAGLYFNNARVQLVPCMIACTAKMIIFPLTVFYVAYVMNVSELMTAIAVIFAIAPTSSASYPLAKQMGGDAPLMATIISFQTLIAVLAIPAVILLLA